MVKKRGEKMTVGELLEKSIIKKGEKFLFLTKSTRYPAGGGWLTSLSNSDYVLQKYIKL